MQSLCVSFSGLRVSSAKVPTKAFTASSLGSKLNGIVAAPKLNSQKMSSREALPVAAIGLEILCADGRRGGKLKTRKSAAKRYRITGTGRVAVRHAGKNHFQEKKSSKRRQKLSGMHLVSETHLDLVKGCLPYAKVK